MLFILLIMLLAISEIGSILFSHARTSIIGIPITAGVYFYIIEFFIFNLVAELFKGKTFNYVVWSKMASQILFIVSIQIVSHIAGSSGMLNESALNFGIRMIIASLIA